MGSSLLVLDAKLFFLINTGMACRFLDATMPLVTDFFIWRFPLLILALFLFLAQGGKHRSLILTIALAAGLTDQVSSRFIKKTIQRPRPCCVEPFARTLMGCKKSESFPSSHAANTAAVAAVVLCMRGWLVGFPVLLLSIIVSFSRVYVGVHYPVDVLYGMLLGLFLGVLVVRGCRFLFQRPKPPDFDPKNRDAFGIASSLSQ